MSNIRIRRFHQPHDLSTWFQSGMDRFLPEFVMPKPGKQINLGAGYKYIDDTEPLGAEQEWWAEDDAFPYADGEVGAIYCYHFFEHLGKDTFFKVLRECERVLHPGAPLTIVVPHYESEGAYHDLDHKTFFTESTWKNLMENTYYDGTMPRNWEFRIGVNLIMGLNYRNLSLFTQLIKKEDWE